MKMARKSVKWVPPTNIDWTSSYSSGMLSAPVTDPLIRRGERLGINAGAGLSDQCAEETRNLGLKWVRFSWEYGWSNDVATNQALVNKAHAYGLKAIVVIQKNGHSYSTTTGLDTFAAQIASIGADIVEGGNEWNNSVFWTAPAITSATTDWSPQANLSVTLAAAIKAANPSQRIISYGMSTGAGNENPMTHFPLLADANVAFKTAGWEGVNVHPYCYPELSTTNSKTYTPLKQVGDLMTAATARSMPTKMFFTEIGCPGFANPGASETVRGVALSYQRQIDCYQAYFQQVRQIEKGINPNDGSALASTPKMGPMIFATAIDGESAVSGVDYGLGLLTAARVKKPVWDYVSGFANELVLTSSGY